MRERPALFVLLMDERGFRTRFPLIAGYVAEAYEPIGQVEVEGAEPVRILARREAPARSSDRATGWPCY
jgi:hypothetical protein